MEEFLKNNLGGILTGATAVAAALTGWLTSRKKADISMVTNLFTENRSLRKELDESWIARDKERNRLEQERIDLEQKYEERVELLTDRVKSLDSAHAILFQRHREVQMENVELRRRQVECRAEIDTLTLTVLQLQAQIARFTDAGKREEGAQHGEAG